MKVKNLIEALQKCDLESEVCLDDNQDLDSLIMVESPMLQEAFRVEYAGTYWVSRSPYQGDQYKNVPVTIVNLFDYWNCNKTYPEE